MKADRSNLSFIHATLSSRVCVTVWKDEQWNIEILNLFQCAALRTTEIIRKEGGILSDEKERMCHAV
jgi:hypothetical protein